ncbi:alkene reductase [Caballeronia sp. DA-9]|uniref:alkene reductase n=1 Tax=Caballeronia sp. DA-9 TaxID=3436237 RepID=UPI003F67AEA3
MSQLFTSTNIGPYTLSHRIVMAPLTRMRSGPGDVPGDLMREYYAQRATQGGLIVAEATPISPGAIGYLGAPGIYTDEQVAGWTKVVDAVHAKGSRIFLQLFHAGRQSHIDLTPNGEAPIAPSALPSDGFAYTAEGWKATSMPRALETHEIAGIVEEFRRAAERALNAGFDGVEIHGANGYLPDQFLQDGSNKRTDEYGGSIENRARFLLEITQAAVSVWGGERVAVRLGPSGTWGGMSDSDPNATFGYAADQLNRFGLAYLHLIEPRIKGSELVSEGLAPVASRHLRKIFKGPIIAAGGFTPESAEHILGEGSADLVAFGRHFISNPDLPERVRKGLPLNAYDRDTFYGGDARGYTDYASADEAAVAA